MKLNDKIRNLITAYAQGESWDELEKLMGNMTREEIEHAEGFIGVAGCLLED